MGFLSDTWDSLSGKAGRQGAQKAGEAERAQIGEGMDYLKGRDELGNEIGDKALSGLSDIYLGDGTAQQGLIDKAKASPLYQQMMLAKEDAGDQLARNASMTGGLRGGNVQDNMYRSDARFDADALATTYQDQLSGITGLSNRGDKNTASIAGMYGDLGRSEADQAVAEADSKGALLNNGLKIAGTIGSFFSDPRLKENLQEVEPRGGHRWFTWDWSAEAEEKLGLVGQSVGVIATLVNEYMPEAISVKNGFLTVDYDMIGEANA